MNLANGGVFGHEQAVTAAQLGNVTQQHQSTGQLVGLHQGQAMHHDGDVGAPLHLGDHRSASGEAGGDGAFVKAQRPKGHPLGIGMEPEAMHG